MRAKCSFVLIVVFSMTALWAADNITFGMGGALLQQLNRDTVLDIAYVGVSGKHLPTLGDYNEAAPQPATCQNGWLDRKKMEPEVPLAFKHAGADGVLMYFAIEVARMLG